MGIFSGLTILLSLSTDATRHNISVWDKVMTSDSCKALHEFASRVGLSHRIFSRNNEEPLSRLEQALDSILTEIGDDSSAVEYWCRQEWKSIEAHADVDERLAIEEQTYRHPQNGHVLYLQVGSQVRGPTCIFPQCSFGGELLTESNDEGKVELITVPAVEGRLLRFEGSLLHAVPRPADLWLLPFTQMGLREPEEDWGRSVVLFNTWPDNPPRGVEPSAFEKPADKIDCCSVFKEWETVKIEDRTLLFGDNSESQKCKIWLLGDMSRRAYANRNVQMRSDTGLKETLEQQHTPTISLISASVM